MNELNRMVIPGAGAVRMLGAIQNGDDAAVLASLLLGNGEVNAFVTDAAGIANDTGLSEEAVEGALTHLEKGGILARWGKAIILNPEIVVNTKWTEEDADLVIKAFRQGLPKQ